MRLYPTKTAPRYLFATKLNLAVICIELAVLVLQIWLVWHLNQAKISQRDKLLEGIEHLTVQEQTEFLGDYHPDFKYVSSSRLLRRVAHVQ